MSDKQGPSLIVHFAGPTSAMFNIQGSGTVSPEQLAVVGEFLLNQARMIWQQQFAEAVMRQKQSQIIVPEAMMRGKTS